MAAGEYRKILQHDGLEQRRHQLVGRGPFFLQAVDVGLGKDPALAGYLVQLDAVIAVVAQINGGDFELGVDLVDDCAGAARAFVVHRRDLFLAAAIRVVFEDDDLGVLAAQLDHRVDFRMHLLDGQRYGGHLLHEFAADHGGDSAASRAGDKYAAILGADARFGFDPAQKLQRLFRLLGLMPLIILPDHLVALTPDHNCLDRRRADVQTYHQFILHRVALVNALRLRRGGTDFLVHPVADV